VIVEGLECGAIADGDTFSFKTYQKGEFSFEVLCYMCKLLVVFLDSLSNLCRHIMFTIEEIFVPNKTTQKRSRSSEYSVCSAF